MSKLPLNSKTGRPYTSADVEELAAAQHAERVHRFHHPLNPKTGKPFANIAEHIAHLTGERTMALLDLRRRLEAKSRRRG